MTRNQTYTHHRLQARRAVKQLQNINTILDALLAEQETW